MSYNRYPNSSHERQDAVQRPTRTILDFGNQDEEIEHVGVRDALLKESGHITRSEQLLDEQFEIASRARENLENQKWTIKNMQTQYNNITNQFQSVNTLIKKIILRKRRDRIILAIVFCICLGLLLYMIF